MEKEEWVLAGIIILLIGLAVSKNFNLNFPQVPTSQKCWVEIPCSNYDECKAKLGFTDELLEMYQVECKNDVCKAYVECGTEVVSR
jgi:hypothetical protein